MLKLQLDPTFTGEVEITVPGTGKTEKVEFTFKYRTAPELEEFRERLEKLGKKDSGVTHINVLPDVISGWDGIDAPYSLENLKLFIEAYPAAPGEIYSAYTGLSIGSRAKN